MIGAAEASSAARRIQMRTRNSQRLATAMNNLYAQWCAMKGLPRKEPYAFKCTAAGSGNDQLPDFKGSASSHFIATTVDLLTTGVINIGDRVEVKA